jgi:putative hydrolase
MHTWYSDGDTGVARMVRAAKERGLLEIAIADHGMSRPFGGLSWRKLPKLISEIESAVPEMHVLLGVESNIVSTKGHIDVDDRLREKLDIVLMGVHLFVMYSFTAWFTFFLPNIFYNILHWVPKCRVRKNTEIVKRAVENNQIDIWTHPNKYFRVNVVDIAAVCAKRGTLIELSGKKIHFRPIDYERMQALGCKFIINSDAHDPKHVGEHTRAEEFLRNCDYDPRSIINLNQSWTDFKKGGTNDPNNVGANQSGNITPTAPQKRGWRRWF